MHAYRQTQKTGYTRRIHYIQRQDNTTPLYARGNGATETTHTRISKLSDTNSIKLHKIKGTDTGDIHVQLDVVHAEVKEYIAAENIEQIHKKDMR